MGMVKDIQDSVCLKDTPSLNTKLQLVFIVEFVNKMNVSRFARLSVSQRHKESKCN